MEQNEKVFHGTKTTGYAHIECPKCCSFTEYEITPELYQKMTTISYDTIKFGCSNCGHIVEMCSIPPIGMSFSSIIEYYHITYK